MDYRRILSRLRSRHAEYDARKCGKKPLAVQLCTVLNDPHTTPGLATTAEGLRELKREAKALRATFLQLEGLQEVEGTTAETQKIIMRIIQQSKDLTATDTLRKVLESAPKPDLSLERSISQKLCKLGRYATATYQLMSIASRNKIFRNIRIRDISRPPPTEVLLPGAVITMQTAIRTVQGSNASSKRKTTRSVQAWMTKKDTTFRQKLSEPSKEWKVHAEIQLLFFYELHPDLQRPRVICSSKKACYLCNEFFRIHGRFEMTRTHGAIYSKWVLPDWLSEISEERSRALSRFVVQLNENVEREIILALRSERSTYQQPNESILSQPLYLSSTSMIRSSSHVVDSMPQSIVDSGVEEANPKFLDDTPYDASEPSLTAADSHRSAPHDMITPMNRIAQVNDLGEICRTGSALSTILPETLGPHRLKKGEKLWRQLSDPDQPLLISTKTIEASLSATFSDHSGVVHGRGVLQTYWVKVERLHPCEQPDISSSAANVVHLGDLGANIDVRMPDGVGLTQVLYLCHGNEVISLQYCNERG